MSETVPLRERVTDRLSEFDLPRRGFNRPMELIALVWNLSKVSLSIPPAHQLAIEP
jgi:hypothetical protein